MQERSPPRGVVRGLGPDGRVGHQELLHTGFRRRQGGTVLPLRDEFGVGEQPHQFLIARGDGRRRTRRHTDGEPLPVPMMGQSIGHALGIFHLCMPPPAGAAFL